MVTRTRSTAPDIRHGASGKPRHLRSIPAGSTIVDAAAMAQHDRAAAAWQDVLRDGHRYSDQEAAQVFAELLRAEHAAGATPWTTR